MTGAWIVEHGQSRPASLDEGREAVGTASLVWFHYHAPRDEAELVACMKAPIPAEVLTALMAEETRPRTDVIDGGALINLRGPSVEEAPTGDPLVSIRIWATPGLLVSVSFRELTSLGEITRQMEAGHILDPGDFVAAVANCVARELDPDVAEIGDDLDDIESAIESGNPLRQRRSVARVRSQAIRYRRFLVPQNMALDRLATLDVPWIEDSDRAKLREAADRASRMAEELESIRERAAVAHEELTDLRAEKLDSRSLTIAIIATLFLPLTFITGLLGMNVEGVPFAHHPGGFWIITGICITLSIAVMSWFWARRWFER